MLDLNKILDMMNDILGRISSKRLMAYLFFLIYVAWFFYWITQQVLISYDTLILDLGVMVGAPFVALIVLLLSFSVRPSGDDMADTDGDAPAGDVPAGEDKSKPPVVSY